jgi:hypothetical protein
MTDVQKNIPESFDFNESDITSQRNAPTPQYVNGGFFKGVITKAERAVANKSSDLMLQLTLQALDSADAVKGPQIRHFVTIPVANPSVAGHKPSQDKKQLDMQYKRAREVIRAVEGDEALPQYPKKRDGQEGVYFDPATGADLTLQERRARADEIDVMTIRKLQQWFRDPSILDRTVLYFGTKKGEKWTNVSYVRNNADGHEVLTENFTG